MPWYQRWRNVFRPEKLNAELDQEFQYHLAETTDRLVAEGLPREEAVTEARLRLGNYSIQKESTRDMNIAVWLDSTRADIAYGLRQLKLNPGFTTIAVLSLALGIGANAAIFQLVNAIRLKTLPVQNPQELVLIDFEDGSVRHGSGWGPHGIASYPQWDQIRAHQQAFSDVMAWHQELFNLAMGGEPHYARGMYVSGSFFRGLGVSAILGRTLTERDDNDACSAGAVISYAFWQRQFLGDAGAIGRKLTLNGYPFPVIGVTPPSFFGMEVGNQYDVAIPICADRLLAKDGKGRMPLNTGFWLAIIGRLKPEWTVARATAHLRAISPEIMRATLPTRYRTEEAKGYLANKLKATEAGSGVSGLRTEYERPLWLLLATTGLVLLISCANLANLLLARAAVREPEIAMRLAIGALRWRLVRQLLAESVLLAAAGAVLGAGLALIISRSLVLLMSTPNNQVFVDLAPDWRMLAFTAGVATLTCLLFGLLPAVRAAYLSPASAMRAPASAMRAPASAMRAGTRVTSGRERFSFRRGLVATQIAISLVLLFGAFLFVRTLNNLVTEDPGFKAEGIFAVEIDFGKSAVDYAARDASAIETQRSYDKRRGVYHEISDRLSAIPGVASVAQVDITPVSGNGWDNLVGVDGAAAVNGKDCNFDALSPGYFKTMGTTVLAGREFNDRDTLSAPKVAIVNETFARTFFGGANPVGHTFRVSAEAGKAEPVYQIVGLVRNSKYHDLREDFQPIAFLPKTQDETPGPGATFVVRVAVPPGPVMNAAKNAIREMDPAIQIEFHALSLQLQNSLLREKLMATLSGGFGFLAAVLALLGLYGVISYTVAQRRNEIGVRVALGATRANVVGLVMREAAVLLGVGLAAGIGLSLWAGTAAATLLFGLKPHDLASLTAAAALLASIALLASYIPARRAAGADPMPALRSD
jgi:predicted permease